MTSTSTSYSTITAAPPSTSTVKTDFVKLPNTQSSNLSSSQSSEPLTLSKKCAIVFPNVESIHVDKYFVAVGEIIGFKNIIFGGKSGQRMVMHLASEDLADSFVNSHDHVMINGESLPVKKLVNPGFKIIFNHVNPSVPNALLLQEISKYGRPISPITYVNTGLRDERLRHIYTYKRQVFVDNKDAIPNSIQVSFGSELNTIYLTIDSLKCYSCGIEGHSIKNCPTKDSIRQPAQDRMLQTIKDLSTDTPPTPVIPDKITEQPHPSTAELNNMFAPSFFPELGKKTTPVGSNAVEDTPPELSKDSNTDVPPEDEKMDDCSSSPQHDGDIEPNPEDRKSAKRPLSPLKKIAQNVEEKKVKVESEFHESFLNAVDATLSKVKSSLSKDDILKLFRETKNARNKNSIILNLGLDPADLKIALKILVEQKISPNMKARIKTLCKHITPGPEKVVLPEDPDSFPEETDDSSQMKKSESVISDHEMSDSEYE
ncbi:hypothetical protein M8J75_012791 [Diaphorina citri]|nr:hypothetical protein M8J75_002142 [Diaphorina citri]KAI5712984.1 hypothetical protein M8J75_012791 [Diaphorina citri]